jgi:predicted LPLAT superfamily acyltransferase
MQDLPKEKSSGWMERAKGNSIGTRLFISIISAMGVVPAYFILFFASLQYIIFDSKTKNILREFRTVAGLKCSWTDLFRHFYSFGMSLIDRYAFLITQKSFFTFSTNNEDFIESEIKKGKGVILLGAHFGNWELAGNLLQGRLHTKVNFLMYDAESKETKDALRKTTQNRLINIIFVGNESTDTTIALVNALNRGEIVCLHGDRILGGQRFENVDFFGKIARFPTGPFVLSVATGAPVIPIFSVKTGILHYTFTALEPIRFDTVSRNERQGKIHAALVAYVSALESMVRKYPFQWFNYYNFWG